MMTEVKRMTNTTTTINEYHVKMTGTKPNGNSAWVVVEHLYDDDPSGKPRVTVISTHTWRHEAIDAARLLAGENMYFVSDCPADESKATDAQIAEFWGQ